METLEQITKAPENQDIDDPRIFALAAHLECDPHEIKEASYGQNTYERGSEEYRVLTDDEADEAWDESLESYIDDCLFCDVAKGPMRDLLETYFDREAWKRDARVDGRGHSSSGYDGHEYDSGEYFIYRHN